MKKLFDHVSGECSKIVTQTYSTSFSLATKMLHPSIRPHIYNIYGFVRFADEIVDSFHQYPKEELLDRFEKELYLSLDQGISLNPILNSFQHTVNTYSIDRELIAAFMKSMRWDLDKKSIRYRRRLQGLYLRLCRCSRFDVFKGICKRKRRTIQHAQTFSYGFGIGLSKG